MRSPPRLPDEPPASGRLPRRALLLSPLPWVAAAWGCSKPPASCSDGAPLSAHELDQRAQLGYVERAPKAELSCERCSQYVAAVDEGCGTCRVMPGPTHPLGYCKQFQPK
jgi:hypothetical protein